MGTWALGALIAALVLPATAAAQPSQGFALDGYEPPPAGDRFFSVESAEVPGHKLGAFGLTGTTATRLLVVEREGDADGTALVALRHTLHVGASVSFWSRLKLSVDLPIEASSGDDLAPLTAPEGVAAGDVRLGARLVVLGGRSRSYRLAIGTRLFLPTGDTGELTSDGDARGSVAVLLGGRSGSVVWTLGPSILVRAPVDYADVAMNDELGWGGALGLLVAGGVGQVAVETFGAAALRGDDAFGAATTRAEILASGRLRLGPFVAGAALGPGLSSGVGTAELRAVVQLAWAPLPRKNRDDGRSPDPVPVLPPPSLPDRDRDGVPDERDACPDRPGPPSELPEASGCPGVDIGVPGESGDASPSTATATPCSTPTTRAPRSEAS